MIKVVVVEDERILRKGLISSVDWTAFGCAVVGEAGNGRDGLELIVETHPDIVITDIRMPMMDGLEMLNIAKDVCHFHAIILSGYSEFEYARRAITLRVVDYLLKPVDEDELQALLGTLAERIRQEKSRSTEEQMVKAAKAGKLTIDASAAEEKLDERIASNHYVNEALREIREHFDQKISIDQIAARLNVSASYLSRKFKEATNHTFLEYLNQYRITKAVQMFSTGQCRVSEIAELTGFSSYKHFYKVFHEYMEISPTELLEQKDKIVFSGGSQEEP